MQKGIGTGLIRQFLYHSSHEGIVCPPRSPAASLVLLLILITVPPAAGANIAAGSITVRSDPGGASVTLDGIHQGQIPVGNDALTIGNIDPGPHQLVLSRSGYLDDHHLF